MNRILVGRKPYPNQALINSAKELALKSHSDTNHFYDQYLPYEFHLRMVVKSANDFIDLIDKDKREIVIAAAWLHDTIEDTRMSYKDVESKTNASVAEIVRAVTNYSRGRNRDERMPDWLYKELKETPGAVYVKLCDRIANIQYSKMSGSSMFEKYKKEHDHFKHMLYTEGYLEVMWEYLENLIIDNI